MAGYLRYSKQEIVNLQQIEIKAEITTRFGNGLGMTNILNRVKETCRTLKRSSTANEFVDAVSAVFTVVQQLESSIFKGYSKKDDLDQPLGLVKRCMEKTEAISSLIPLAAEASGASLDTSKLCNAYQLISKLLRCDFQLADCFIWLCHLGDIGTSILDMDDIRNEPVTRNNPPIRGVSQMSFNETSAAKESGKKLRKQRKRNQHLHPVPKEERTQSPAPVAEYPNPNVAIVTGQQHIEMVMQCESQLATALDALKKHLSSTTASEHYNLSAIIPHMQRLNDEIDCFLATRVKCQRKRVGIQDPAASNRPANTRPDPALRETNVDEIPSTSMSPPDGSMSESTDAESDDYSDFEDMDLLDLLQKPDTQSSYTEPTEELLEAMDRLCQKYGVTDAEWSHSAKEKSQLIIHGRGVSREGVKQELETEMRKAYPSHQYVFAELADPATTNLSCVVLQQTCNKTKPDAPWKESEKATCEAVFSGKQPHKGGRQCYFAATSAHLLLTETEQTELASRRSNDFQRELDYARREVYKRMDECVYHVTLQTNPCDNSDVNVHLCNPPLLGYRTNCVARDATHNNIRDYVPSDFMTDIALIPIESVCDQKISAWVTSNDLLLSGIYSLSAEKVKSITEREFSVFASKGRTGKTVPMKKAVCRVEDDERVTKGLHIPFILDDGCEPFEEGDSGSVIYVKLGNPPNQTTSGRPTMQYNMAIGLLKGNRPEPEQNVYEAVVLAACVDSISKDYRHLVDNLKLCTNGPEYPRKSSKVKSRKGPVPPKLNAQQ